MISSILFHSLEVTFSIISIQTYGNSKEDMHCTHSFNHGHQTFSLYTKVTINGLKRHITNFMLVKVVGDAPLKHLIVVSVGSESHTDYSLEDELFGSFSANTEYSMIIFHHIVLLDARVRCCHEFNKSNICFASQLLICCSIQWAYQKNSYL